MAVDGLYVGRKGSKTKGPFGSPILEPLEARLLLSGSVVISEFMASNGQAFPDGHNPAEYTDWIELHNPTDAPVTLDGWYLTDKSGNLDKWQFPDTSPDITIAPGGYMVVFASGQDDEDYPYHDGTYYHTNFSLSKENESVLLVRPDGVTVEHGYEDYPEQFTDVSYGIYLDSDPWETLIGEEAKLSYQVPTASDAGLLPVGEGEGEQGWTAVDFDDSEWTDAMVFGPADIVITEISIEGVNFVEIQNASLSSLNNADLTVLVNNGSAGINSVNATQWQLPDSIAPGEILYKTDSVGDNYWGAPIDWTAEGPGWAMVVDEGGAEVEVMDFVVWGYTEAQIATLDISYGGDDHITVGGQWSGDAVDVTGGGELGPEEDAIVSGHGLDGAVWNYLHPTNGADPMVSGGDPDFHTTWMKPAEYDGPAFDQSGKGILGYGGIGMGGVYTNIGEPPRGQRYTAYFRSEFTITDDMKNVGIELLSDDGGVIYIDGVEVARNNFSLDKEDTYFVFTNGNGNENGTATLSITDLDAGTHTIAVSIHQTGNTSSDLGFNLRLFGRPVSGGGFIRRTGSSDGDTASDFQANNESTKGVTNPGITVPFGVITDTTTGIGFSDNQQAFEDVIATDVGGAGKMQGVNTSLWMRIEFVGSGELSAMETLTLSMMYDDGFVAYLNGVQVAQRNGPVTLAWNSSAAAVHPNSEAVAYEEIDITPHIGLLREGANVLAIHGLNFDISDTDFLICPNLIATRSEPMSQYFAQDTPNQANTEEWWRYVEDTSFDHDRGFYTEPFNLVISTDTAGAQIYYTTNGTSPLLSDGGIHADATLYTSPVSIATTTAVRAVAVKSGYAPTNVDTHTYIFLEDIFQQPAVPDGFPPDWKGVAPNYDMNQSVVTAYGDTIRDDMQAVPTVSIVTSVEDMFGVTGIYSNPGSQGTAWEKPASVEWINTDGSTLFQVNGGVQIVGGASRGTGTKKHSFRLLFKRMYGPTTLDYPVFDDTDIDEFNTITLRAGFNDTFWGGTILQDRWAHERQLAAGGFASHGNFVHLYVDGLYWGLYNPLERPDDAFAASYLGGEKEDYDVLSHPGITLRDGTATAWNLLRNLANDAVGNYAAIEEILDIPDFCDYLIVNQFGSNWDWPQNNWYATYNREGGGKFRFHCWDAEGCLNNGNRMEQFGGAAGLLYQKLRAVPEFRSVYADRAHRLMFNDGPLTPQANIAWLDEISAGIYDAVVGEAARWGGSRSNWESRINSKRTSYFPQRTATFLGQIKAAGLYPNVDAPSFNINGSHQHGGMIDLGGELTIDAPAGEIYYTLDGSDPSSGGTLYSGASVALSQGGHVKSRVYNGGVWSALNEATYYIDVSADIRITEIMYNPADPTQDEIDAGYTDADDFEYIEITNISTTDTLPLTGLRFDNGIDFVFGEMSIDPGEYVVVASNEDAFNYRYGSPLIKIAGEYGTGIVNGSQLANSGENVELDAPIGGIIQGFSFSDAWYDHTDGEGFSLTFRNVNSDLDRWDEKDGWRPSAAPGGSPGYGDSLTDPGVIVVSEVLAHTDAPQMDTIELYNRSGSPIDVSGWWLSDEKTDEFGAEVLNKYQIPPGSVIGAKGYLVLDESNHFGGEFLLSEHGDHVYLSSDAGGVAGGYRQHVDFGGSPNGVSIGLYAKSVGGTDFTLLRTPFLGAGNGAPYVEDLVINEVMYHPSGPTPEEIDAGFTDDGAFEFIEIYNKSDTVTYALSDFYISGGIGFTFGWCDADSAAGSNMWTLEAGATATWDTALAADNYEVFARWDLPANASVLDEQARYSITHSGATPAVVVRDQNADASAWVSLGTYSFDANAQVVLTRGTENPDNWTIADAVKFVRAGHADVILDNPTLDSWNTANGPSMLGPGQYAVIVSDREAFDYRYNYPAITGQNAIPIAGRYTGNLSDSGEKIKLMRAGNPETDFIPYYRIDHVNYGDSFPWPEEPDGDGPSLSRSDPYGPSIPFPYGNDPGSWFAGLMNGSPGEANSPADLTAPTIPQNVTAQVGSPYTRIELTWEASADNDTFVDHYIIYRGGDRIGVSESPAYVDTDTELFTPYSYEVSAVNRDGLESARSAVAEIAISSLVSYSTPTDMQIVLVFSEPLVEGPAENRDNYTFDATLLGARLEADNVTVTLTTSHMIVGQEYTLTVSGLQTVSGAIMPPGRRVSFVYGQPTGGNAPIVANPIGDLNVGEDAAETVLDLELAGVFNDPDAGDALTYSIAGNTNSRLVVADITAGELHLSYIADRNGEAAITVRATDQAGAWAEDTFNVTVESISDDPVVAEPLADVNLDEDAADTVLDLAGVFYDPDIFHYDPNVVGDDDILALSITGNTNGGLVTADLDGNELTLSCSADQNGTADITVRATDSNANWVEDTFTVTVAPVNDAPVVSGPLGDVVVDENAGDTVLDLDAAFGDADIAADGDSLVFSVTGNTNPVLVDTGDAGVLSYATGLYGTAEITVRATDLAGAWTEDTFTVAVGSDAAASVDHLMVKSGAWSDSFLDALDAGGLAHPNLSQMGYRIGEGSGQLDPLPWSKIDALSLSFSRDVSVVQGDLVLYDVTSTPCAIDGFSYNSSTFTATWTLTDPIGPDRLSIDMDGGPVGDFQFSFNVLPGDTDRSGQTDIPDAEGIRSRLFLRAGAPGYSVLHDINGSGRSDFIDWSIVRANLGVSLPAGAPIAPSDSMAMAMAAGAPAAAPLETSVQTLAPQDAGDLIATVEPVVDLFAVSLSSGLVESLSAVDYNSEHQPISVGSSAAALYLAATAGYDLRPLSDDLVAGASGDDLLADILAESDVFSSVL